MIDWGPFLASTSGAVIGVIGVIAAKIIEIKLGEKERREKEERERREKERGQAVPPLRVKKAKQPAHRKKLRTISLILFLVGGTLFFVSAAVGVWIVLPPQWRTPWIPLAATAICGVIAIVFGRILRSETAPSTGVDVGQTHSVADPVSLHRRDMILAIILSLLGIAVSIVLFILP